MSSGGTMTTAEYAKHRGVSDSYIRRMKRKGNLVLAAGDRIDVKASDELLAGITNPVQGGKREAAESTASGAAVIVVAPSPVVSVQEAVRRERLARARLAELELGEEAGQLTRVEAVNRAVFTLVRQALNRLRGQSGRLRRVLANETDPLKVAEILDEDVADTCKEMRAAAERLLNATTGETGSTDVDTDADADDADGDEDEGCGE